MKCLFCGDVHWSSSSSIIRKQGEHFTHRLDNLIKTINWVEETSKNMNCDRIIYLGDFFDKPTLSDIEITALRSIKWNTSIPHQFLVGNHDSSVSGLNYSSSKALEGLNMEIISTPITNVYDNVQITYLPYITEDNRQPLNSYITNNDECNIKLIVSHNDIKDVQMGLFISQTGFSIKEIEANCDLFLNGHLHNGNNITSKIINVGNISGQNFSEDAFKYDHHVIILDTATRELEYVENPFAYNFYKLEINTKKDLDSLYTIKDNAVLSTKCNENYIDDYKEIIQNKVNNKIVESRLITIKNISSNNTVSTIEDFSIDHLKKFTEFCLTKIENTQELQEELSEVCK